jgi:hypothetical protein
MGNYFLKTGKSTDQSFEFEQEALDTAKGISERDRKPMFVIKSGDQYFVSTTDNVQRYEELIASFKSGLRVLLQTP